MYHVHHGSLFSANSNKITVYKLPVDRGIYSQTKQLDVHKKDDISVITCDKKKICPLSRHCRNSSQGFKTRSAYKFSQALVFTTY
jgi:hypothetical protein